MKYKYTFEKYDSKFATFISLIQNSGLFGLLIIFILLSIPAFIALFSGETGATIGILFGGAMAVAIVVYLLIVFKVDPDEVDKAISASKEADNAATPEIQSTNSKQPLRIQQNGQLQIAQTSNSTSGDMARQKIIGGTVEWLLSYASRLKCERNFFFAHEQIEKEMNAVCEEYEMHYGRYMYFDKYLNSILLTMCFKLTAIGIYYIFELQNECAELSKSTIIERVTTIFRRESPIDSSPINGTSYKAAKKLFVHDILNFPHI